MGSRAFDPFFLEQIDQQLFDDRSDETPENDTEPLSIAVRCPNCNKGDLVFDNEQLVELDGHQHECEEGHYEEPPDEAGSAA